MAHGRADGSDAAWTGSVPTDQLCGKARTRSSRQPPRGSRSPYRADRSSARPRHRRSTPSSSPLSSPRSRATPRTNLTNLTASYWEYYGGRAAFELWNDHASRKIFEYRLDTNPPRAALVYALVHMASHDALIAGWDAKYTYWHPRPQMVDPTITTVIPTPNHPSYPSAHSFWSGAAGAIMGRLFPRDAAYFNGLADESAESRIMGGIHYRTDCNVGLTLGRQVADAVWSRARADAP